MVAALCPAWTASLVLLSSRTHTTASAPAPHSPRPALAKSTTALRLATRASSAVSAPTMLLHRLTSVIALRVWPVITATLVSTSAPLTLAVPPTVCGFVITIAVLTFVRNLHPHLDPQCDQCSSELVRLRLRAWFVSFHPSITILSTCRLLWFQVRLHRQQPQCLP
jgi:hypothetical protein